MGDTQRKYRTRQRTVVLEYLGNSSERYLSVDDVWMGVCAAGTTVGRTTVYRCLEGMATEGSAWKITSPGGEARYRIAGSETQSQLVCLECGRALPLDCHMVADFSQHVLEHHGFAIDRTRTVLYGICKACREAQ